jgi:xanthine phosphoribosyltransferase
MKKVYVSWNDVQRQVQEILRQMLHDQWRPDYVVGITRGGLVPANLISQYLDCRMETLQVRLRDGKDEGCESNCWMSEDAFGYESHDPMASSDGRKNILIVDDINDTGATLNWIKQDWMSSCLPTDERWNEVWGNNVRVATLYDNEVSKAELPINYCAETINKANDPQWVVFPWEEWWRRWNPAEEHQ